MASSVNDRRSLERRCWHTIDVWRHNSTRACQRLFVARIVAVVVAAVVVVAVVVVAVVVVAVVVAPIPAVVAAPVSFQKVDQLFIPPLLLVLLSLLLPMCLLLLIVLVPKIM